MVSIPPEKVRLHLNRSTRSGVIPEPILFVSARPGTGCADERVHFCVAFEPDGLFSRHRGSEATMSDPRSNALPEFQKTICVFVSRSTDWPLNRISTSSGRALC